ncbi:hypothetical protein AKG11_31630 [Shinella sp. SUS2]|jgi:hypothetical protein|nr:hypothetical protein AKG11_31630 [Shinella sp. SUS2]KOC71738.1 hypothetical protein AKG10_31335 [Shinella sp. GWS1]
MPKAYVGDMIEVTTITLDEMAVRLIDDRNVRIDPYRLPTGSMPTCASARILLPCRLHILRLCFRLEQFERSA